MNRLTGGNVLIDPQLIIKKAGISDKMKVADLGCGSLGHFVFPTAKVVGKKGKMYAVDILKTILENIQKRARQDGLDNIIETVWTDLEIFGATKIESGSLDVAMLINTLYQSHKRVEILRESIRMVKKDGKLLVVEWENIATPLGPPAEERVKSESLIAAAPKLGLKLEEGFEAGQYHYGLIFTKL
jgi:ubiquinone/menaquinone biosynthesis C-methylase UbiE